MRARMEDIDAAGFDMVRLLMLTERNLNVLIREGVCSDLIAPWHEATTALLNRIQNSPSGDFEDAFQRAVSATVNRPEGEPE